MKAMLRLTGGVLAMLGAGIAAAAALAASPPGGDPAAGERLFARCAACHAIGPGATARMGPPLNGVIGRAAASITGFAYSPALRGAGIVWTAQRLDAFLTAPMKRVPGTRMAFAGVAAPKDRADLIAYLARFDPGGAKR